MADKVEQQRKCDVCGVRLIFRQTRCNLCSVALYGVDAALEVVEEQATPSPD